MYQCKDKIYQCKGKRDQYTDEMYQSKGEMYSIKIHKKEGKAVYNFELSELRVKWNKMRENE